jgi:transglutaminase-like putative cysteine protease
MQAEWSRLFASLNYRASSNVDFYSQEMNLGGPRQLAEVPVLAVEAPAAARYWRAVVFDEFGGRGWQNNNDTLISFGAENELPPLINDQARQLITQTITVLGPSMSVLPMAAQPLWVDQLTRAGVSYVSVPSQETDVPLDEAGSRLQVDTISFARTRTPIDAGDHYTVNSLLSQASVRQLREAGTDYPDWVNQRYLQLPDSVSARVKELAGSIAAPFDNPYDKASAIESYLRREITYNERINAPPPDRDPVDYILFDLKEAYCDYYATSMAVMLRSLGIPARLVSGYAQGHYDPSREAFVVLLQDAHTWVEVFFPNYGWIEFEPTAAQPVIARPLDPQDALGQDSEGVDAVPTPDPLERMEELLGQPLPPDLGSNAASPWAWLNPTKPGAWVGGTLVLLALAGIVVWMTESRRTARLGSVAAIYHNMLRLAGWAGASTPTSQTPHEHAAALGQVVPDGEKPAQYIAGLYTRERYGHKPSGPGEQTRVNRAWRELRPKLVRTTVLRQLTRRLGR